MGEIETSAHFSLRWRMIIGIPVVLQLNFDRTFFHVLPFQKLLFEFSTAKIPLNASWYWFMVQNGWERKREWHIYTLLLSQKALLIFYSITRIFLVIPLGTTKDDSTQGEARRGRMRQANESGKRIGSLSDIAIINLFVSSLSVRSCCLWMVLGKLACMQLTSIQMDDIDTFGGERVRESLHYSTHTHLHTTFASFHTQHMRSHT